MDIFHDVLKYYIQFLSELHAFTKEIWESANILESLLCPKGFTVIAFFIIAIIFALFAIKVKGVMLGSLLVIAVYSLLKHFKGYTQQYGEQLDRLIRSALPKGLVVIFGDPKHFAIGFLFLSVVIVIILAFIRNMIRVAIILVVIFMSYKLYVRHLKDMVGSDNYMLEILGVTVSVLIMIYLFYWICDMVLVLFFALLGNSILLAYVSAIFDKPENYIRSLEELLGINTISDLKNHPNIIFLILPALLFFMIQKGMFIE